MELLGKEHYELMTQFEKEFKGRRMDREAKKWWSKGWIYQDGAVNDLFMAYRMGVAYGRVTA